jgi:hypothetical protein
MRVWENNREYDKAYTIKNRVKRTIVARNRVSQS